MGLRSLIERTMSFRVSGQTQALTKNINDRLDDYNGFPHNISSCVEAWCHLSRIAKERPNIMSASVEILSMATWNIETNDLTWKITLGCRFARRRCSTVFS